MDAPRKENEGDGCTAIFGIAFVLLCLVAGTMAGRFAVKQLDRIDALERRVDELEKTEKE